VVDGLAGGSCAGCARLRPRPPRIAHGEVPERSSTKIAGQVHKACRSFAGDRDALVKRRRFVLYGLLVGGPSVRRKVQRRRNSERREEKRDAPVKAADYAPTARDHCCDKAFMA
jgi:hypothetical protein